MRNRGFLMALALSSLSPLRSEWQRVRSSSGWLTWPTGGERLTSEGVRSRHGVQAVAGEPSQADAERDAIVAWLRGEAEGMRCALALCRPGHDMAPLYAARGCYYDQAAGMIARGSHRIKKCDEPSSISP